MQLLARKITKGIHSCKLASLNCPTVFITQTFDTTQLNKAHLKYHVENRVVGTMSLRNEYVYRQTDISVNASFFKNKNKTKTHTNWKRDIYT